MLKGIYKMDRSLLKIIMAFTLVTAVNVSKSAEWLLFIDSLICFIYIFFLRLNIKSLIKIMVFASVLSFIQFLTAGSDIVFCINVFGSNMNFYSEGIEKGFLMFLRILGSMGIVSILLGTMGIGRLTAALRKLKLPAAFIEVLILSIKFINIFKEEISSVTKAQRVRLGYGSPVKSIQTLGSAGGIVLCRGFDRSKVLSKAMKSRGFDGNNTID